MEFRWNEWNVLHVAGHGVTPEEAEEAEEAVIAAKPPWPQRRPDDKWLAWGRTCGGRVLQVAFIEDFDGSIYVIHARPLTDREKASMRRRKR